MIDSFSTALGTALTGFVTDVTGAIGSNLPTVLTVTLGIVGIGLIWAVVRKFAGAR